MFSTSIFGLFIAAIVGFVLGWLLRQFIGQKKLAKADEIARNLIEEAKTEGEDLKRSQLLEAKEEIFQLKQNFERESKSKFNEIQRMEKQLSNRELNLDKKVDVLNKKEQDLNVLSEQLTSKKGHLDKRARELEQLIEEENAKLERISGLSSEEAKRIQMQNLVETAKRETALEIQELRDHARQTATREAREIIIQAIQRSAIDQIVDTTVAVVNLPDDEMKGRIIGREGRNIRTFESATGIEVLIDDTPKTVVLSGFDPWRREIARQAMEKLIYDGRIHPGRIEEVVDKTRQEVNERILEIGEQAVLDMGLHGLNLELVRLLGKQHFKTSYGQNLLLHSKEVSALSGMIATQLGLDVRLAKRAGLLHDIGKVGEEYGETPAHEIGIELAKRYGENEIVQNAIAAQSPFDDVEITSPISIIVQVADAVSVSRPGAQKEMLENYLKRMRNLEQVAASFSGVERAYAIQAGKEIRVIVEHSTIEDTRAQILANDITKKIKHEVEYPGQVKVTVIREYRSVDYAT
ncbi:ribonuclease Y [candidate division KSB1 bacterium]|nr:ribonuclease Y [candidate division KSB1 bacterium]